MTRETVWALYPFRYSAWWGVGLFEVTFRGSGYRIFALGRESGGGRICGRTRSEALLRFRLERPAERVRDFSGMRAFSAADDVAKALETEVEA